MPGLGETARGYHPVLIMVGSSPPVGAPTAASPGYLRELWRRREFAWYMASGNLKARNASTALGLVWWVLNPLLLGLVYFLVFGVIFGGRRGDDFLEYLLSGMFVFHFTQLSMLGGANSILSNAKLLVNLDMPRLILPIANLIEAAIGFLASIGVFFLIVMPASGVYPDVNLAFFLIPFTLQLFFNLGLGAMAARLTVPFRDLNNLIPYLSRIWLYLSPIIWPLSFASNAGDVLTWIIEINPMWSLLGLYRTALLGWPFEWADLWATAAWTLGVLVIGVWSFVRYEGKMARHL